jgi:hypothetical protein
VLNVKSVSRSVGVGDIVVNAMMILDVDPHSIATGFTLDVDPPSVETEFMPKYEAMFGDERAKDSADDRPVPELSNMEKVLLQQALAEHALEVPDCQDSSHVHMALADGLLFDDSVSPVNHDNVII